MLLLDLSYRNDDPYTYSATSFFTGSLLPRITVELGGPTLQYVLGKHWKGELTRYRRQELASQKTGKKM